MIMFIHPIRTFNIIEMNVNVGAYKIFLNIDLDSYYKPKYIKIQIIFEELAGYETTDIEKGIKYALGFFDK